MNNILTDFWTSRKAQAALIIIVLGLFGGQVGLEDEQITNIVNGMIAFILGRAIHDHGIVTKTP